MASYLPTYDEISTMDPDWAPESPEENFPRTTLSRTLKRTVVKKKKPGRMPKVPDFKLTDRELGKRNARRQRNRDAATRCREKKRGQTADLEVEVENLTAENSQLERGNAKLRAELKRMKNALMAADAGLSTMTECQGEMDQFLDQNSDQDYTSLDEYLDEQLAPDGDKEPVFQFPDVEPEQTKEPVFQPEEYLEKPVNPAENFMGPELVQKVPMTQGFYNMDLLRQDPFDMFTF